MGVNGGPGVWRRLKEAYNRNWPWSRSTSARDGIGTVIFASTSEVLPFVYRPNLSVRDICTEAAVKVDISPVALDFFTLVHVTEDGKGFLNPNKVLSESECSQVYFFRLCIKACHGMELKDFDKKAFEYYFHQCRQDFLSGEVGEVSNQNLLAQLFLYEIVYLARRQGAHVSTKDVIDNPVQYRIKKLLHRGIFADYPLEEKKRFLRANVTQYEVLTDSQLKSDYVSALERAEDFFVYKFSFEKVYVQVSRKFEVLISAEFGIKKRRLDIENSLPEVIVEKFSDIQGLEFDRMRNVVRILRKEFKTEELTASSTQDADSLMTLVEGYYRLMVNQYKQLNLRGSKSAGAIPCHGPISRKKAEDLFLKGSREDGSFLLRRKRSNHWNRVLSVYVADKMMNYDIIWDDSTYPGFFHLKDAKRAFSDLSGLVQHYKETADGLPVCLKEILRPNTEGLAALLDRQILVPTVPEVHLVSEANQIDNLIIEPGNSLSEWGEFGEVKKGSWFCASAEEQLCVISRALVKPIGREKIKQFKQAMSTFVELQNPYLPQFYGTTQTERALIFVFEFAAEGPLDQYIKNESTKEKGITKGRVISYAAQIAEGMMFLHSKNCVHGRLNAHNVLVANEECIKISDFGLLYLVQNGQSFYHSRGGSGYCWFSPQSLHDHTFTVESDIWTFGLTLWEMFAMKRPFHCSLTGQALSENEVMRRYLTGQYLNPDRPNCPPSVGNLIKKCCAPEPKDRMSFRELVTELRSPELVSDDQAQSILLQPEITQLEDWEILLRTPHGNLELEALPNDSQVSNGDYSCLPENVVQDEVSANDDGTRNLRGISLITSIALFDNTTSRKQSLSKTFSHPGLVLAYEAESTLPSREPFSFLPVRKPSITRVSSCPPSIQAGSDDDERSEPTERQQKERYVPCPRPSAEVNQKESQVFVTGMEDPDTVSSEEPVESDGSSNEDSSTDDGGAEAMAMRSLAKHLPNTSIHQTSVDSLPPDVETQPDLLSVCSDVNGDHDEEKNEQVSESGSSAYITRESVTSTQSSLPVHPTEEKPEKSRAGSYVTLTTATKESMSQNQVKGSSILHSSSGAHSTVDNPVVPVQSMQPPVSNEEGTSYTAAKCSSSNAEKQTPHSPDVSPYQNQPRMKQTSQFKYGGLVSVPCKSPDELLGSLSQDSIQKGMGSLALTDLLSDIDDGSFEEEPSPLITDTQEESEEENGDFRGDAELSLGKFSLPVSNVGLELNKLTEQSSFSLEKERNHFNSQPRTAMDRAKESTNNELCELDRQEVSTLSEDSQLSLGKFAHPLSNVGSELGNFSDQSPFALEGEHANLQPHADTNLDSAKVSEDYISNREFFQNSQEENSTLSEQSQEVDSSQGFNPYQFLATNTSTGLTVAFHLMPELINEDWGEESDPDNGDAGDTSDTELDSLCAPVGYSPDKSKVFNCPFLAFDQAQEKLEMKEFSMNNLSKANLKSTEFTVFEEDHFLGQEISSLCSNQLDDAHNEDGCSLNGDQESECGLQGNIWVDPGYKEMGDLKETAESTAGTTDGNYIDKEAQLARNMDNHSVGESLRGQAPDEAIDGEDDEPIASLSRSSSSEGIWPSPDAMERGYQQRTSTIDSCSSAGDEPLTLDISKIPQQLQIPYEQLHIHGNLGQGQFGEVKQATITSTDSPKKEEVAVKVLKDKATKKDSSDFIKEVQNMIELESKQQCLYIIKLRGVAKNPEGKLMLVTELAPLGSLQAYLPKNKEILQIPQLLDFCMQICKGMRYLENQSLLHKDLAARNILVMREDLVKISDFGLSRLQDYYKIQESSKVPVKWYALESLLKQRFTTKSDVWSFGVTMWEIFTYGDRPYGDMISTELVGYLEAGKRLPRPLGCPSKVYDVMHSCWLKDASKRPTFFLLETNDLAALLEESPVSSA